MASTANYGSTPTSNGVRISTANTNRDGTGTIGTVFAPTSGGRVDKVNIAAIGTTTAGMVRLYRYTGSAYILLREVLVSAITPSATVQAFNAAVAPCSDGSPLILASGESLRASTHNAESFDVTVVDGGGF